MTDLDPVLAQIAAEGLLVNNLFQTADRRWRASLRHAGLWGYEFGEGPGPCEALGEALRRAKAGGSFPIPKQDNSGEGPKVPRVGSAAELGF